MDEVLEARGNAAVLAAALGVPRDRVVQLALGEGRRYWAKRAVPAKGKRWHRWQAVLAALVPLPILRPTVSAGGVAALAQEMARIDELARMGHIVPDIVASGGDLLVLEDLGPDLKRRLEGEGTPAMRRALACDAAAAIARLHASGTYHGRPRVNDLIEAPSGIGFLDLEERPGDVMPLAHCQARDLWLFLVSLSRFQTAEEPLIEQALDAYMDAASPSGVPRPLTGLVRLLRPLRWIVTALGPHRFGRDLRHEIGRAHV